MDTYEKALKISNKIKTIAPYIPKSAIILGSGLGTFAKSIKVDLELNYSDIDGFPVSTVQGHAGKLIFGTVKANRILAMQGRFHLYEGYSTEEVTLPIRIFKLLGIENLIVTNACGAVNREFNPGELMIIKDHISLFCPSPLFGKNDERFGARFPSMSEAYSKELIAIANTAAKENNIILRSGVYCYCQGPMYETPAEIRFLSNCGCDAVGMSTVPEVIVAAHCGLNILGISCLTNMASGILDAPLSHEDVIKTSKEVENKFSVLMQAIIEKI